MKNIEVIRHLCEMHSKETLISAAIIAGSMEVCIATSSPSSPEIAQMIQTQILKQIEAVLDLHGLDIERLMKA